MTLRRQLVGRGDAIHNKWHNSPLKRYEGSLDSIRAYIPTFERCGFGSVLPDGTHARQNQRLDTILRCPIGEDKSFVPVGIVSKDYTLIQHSEVLGTAIKAFKDVKVSLADIRTILNITEYGERMSVSLFLPKKYDFDPGDGHPMALRLECLNSVEGSTRFLALVGWFRFVCSNGLAVGITRLDVHRRHVGAFKIDDIGDVLKYGLLEFESDKKYFAKWQQTRVPTNRLAIWIEEVLWRRWGFKAAARAFHIARMGKDVEIVGPYKGSTPTTIAVKETRPVPGAPPASSNLFDVSQILAWLAQDRRDFQEQVDWREEIPELLTTLS